METKNFYKRARKFINPLFRFLYHPTIINSSKIPSSGAILFIGNHRHVLDQLPVILSTDRHIRWMAKKEYFEGKLHWLFEKSGCICVDRYGNPTLALRKAAQHLIQGDCIGLFPEGTRNKHIVLSEKIAAIDIKIKKYSSDSYKAKRLNHKREKMRQELNNFYEVLEEHRIKLDPQENCLPFTQGAAFLAKKTRVWVVPFGVTGDFSVFNKNLTLIFGDPFKIGQNASNKEITEFMRNKVIDLVEKSQLV